MHNRSQPTAAAFASCWHFHGSQMQTDVNISDMRGASHGGCSCHSLQGVSEGLPCVCIVQVVVPAPRLNTICPFSTPYGCGVARMHAGRTFNNLCRCARVGDLQDSSRRWLRRIRDCCTQRVPPWLPQGVNTNAALELEVSRCHSQIFLIMRISAPHRHAQLAP